MLSNSSNGSTAAQNSIKRNSLVYHIPDGIKKLADNGIKTEIQKLKLVTSIDKRTKFGGRNLTDNSRKSYETYFKGLRYFFSLIGDYTSLLMLLDHPPEPFCPSMSVYSIDLFIRFKRQPKDSVLKDCNGKVIKSVLKATVKCAGGWNDPKIVKYLLSAVGALHSARNQRGQYFEPCSDCLKLPEHNMHKGCRFHAGSPHLWRRGNPRDSDEMNNSLSRSNSDGSTYVPNGDSALLPHELVLIRDYLVSMNSIWAFTMWVMTIIACKLFLRVDELITLSFDSIVYDITVCRVITVIGFKIQGKTDKKPVTLTLWADDDYPEFCPIRALCLYLRITGVKMGYLFPNKASLIRMMTNGDVHEFDEVMEYSTYQNYYKSMCSRLLNRVGPFGTHSNRKTAYLLGVWGKGGDSDLMQSARHKSISNALKYREDAKYLLNVAEQNGCQYIRCVSEWKPIFCKDVQMAKSLNWKSTNRCKPIFELAMNYINMMSVCAEDTLTTMIKKTVAYKRVASSKEDLYQYIGSLPQEISADILPLLERYTSDLARNQVDNGNNEGKVSKVRAVCEDSAKPPKKRKCGDNDLTERKQFKNKSIDQKVEFVVRIHKEIIDQRDLTSGARTFFQNVIQPVFNCVQNHFGGDESLFKRTYPDFAHSTFRQKICDGKNHKHKYN